MTVTIGTGFKERYFSASDGLRLYARDYGRDNPRTTADLPIVCLPGLSRNSRDFHYLALQLSLAPERPRRVVTLDYRGRGLSGWDTDKSHYQLPIEAEDVVIACGTLDIAQAIFIGTSRGGLTLHLLAASHPALLRGVVLNDIGPVIELAGLAAIRDYLQAQNDPHFWPHAWAQAAETLQRTHGAAFPALSSKDWLEMADAIFREQDGMIRPDYDPALVEPLATMDMTRPLPDLLPDLWALYDELKKVPLMAIRGENSTLLSVGTFEEMAKRHPELKRVTAKGQGHAPLLHFPDLQAEITGFINGISG